MILRNKTLFVNLLLKLAVENASQNHCSPESAYGLDISICSIVVLALKLIFMLQLLCSCLLLIAGWISFGPLFIVSLIYWLNRPNFLLCTCTSIVLFVSKLTSIG